jgi:hypothetical protein
MRWPLLFSKKIICWFSFYSLWNQVEILFIGSVTDRCAEIRNFQHSGVESRQHIFSKVWYSTLFSCLHPRIFLPFYLRSWMTGTTWLQCLYYISPRKLSQCHMRRDGQNTAFDQDRDYTPLHHFLWPKLQRCYSCAVVLGHCNNNTYLVLRTEGS